MEKGKPIILVPYRNRKVHKECFLLYMNKHFPDLDIAIIEQDNNKPWNKGFLFNIGYEELTKDYDYLVLHDIDMIPVPGKVDYSYCENPTIIATECSQFDYKMPYSTFFGGVIVISKKHYELVNGFSNRFQGYGGEDDLFYRSFITKGIVPQQKPGRFECFAHPRLKDKDEYENNLMVLSAGRDFNEGLSTIEYSIHFNKEQNNYIHLKVDF